MTQERQVEVFVSRDIEFVLDEFRVMKGWMIGIEKKYAIENSDLET